LRLALHQPDFTTAIRVTTTINGELGGKFASARDSGTIDVVVPFHYEGNTVELLALLENLNIYVDSKSKVVLNERTGTVSIGEKIQIAPVAISHGDLSIEVKGAAKGTKPERVFVVGNGFLAPEPKQGESKPGESKPGESKTGTSVADLVRVLNTLGVQPKDLTAIFQTLKESGALQAELEIM
jgi:flagellar P-ring protein FlgI